jgi:HAE1 family hydrophobic/amphiphilic exporter-1
VDGFVNSIINFVIRNKLAVWLLTFIVTITGMYAGANMKKEMIPDISIPYVIVMAVYPGAAPEQVMDEVTIPLEDAIGLLPGVKSINSSSYSNMTTLQVEYDYSKDMDEAQRQIRSAIEQLKLPDNVMEPTITRFSMNAMPVLGLSISSESMDITDLTHVVETQIMPELRRMEGASAAMYGQHIEEIELTYDEARMASLGLTEENVKQMIQISDAKVPLGLFPFEDAEQAVVVDGKVTTVDQLKQILIPVTPSETNPVPFVTLGDIAQVELIGRVESVSRTNGQDAIAIQVTKAQDANTVDVVNDVKKLVERFEADIEGLKIDITLNQATMIEDSISTMISKALFGAGFAILIILLFLRDIKSTIISVISIPLSILIALLLLYGMDISLNLMTLGAMTVAIGRVIDDSIVVVENIYRRLHLKDEPMKGRALIRSATIEMFKPILSSTLVTVAVFLPLVFVGGMVGELFMPFALTMAFALGASLLVAITVVPSLAHTLFKKQLRGEKLGKQHKEAHGVLARGYKRILDVSLRHKVITSLIAVLLLVGSCLPVYFGLIGVNFLSNEAEKVMYLTYTPKPGEQRDDVLKNIEVVEEMMLAREDVDIVQLSVGGTANEMTAMLGAGSNGALMYVIFDPDTENFDQVTSEVLEEIQALGQSGSWKSQDFSSMFASSEHSYTVYGEDLEAIEEAVSMIEAVMRESDKLKDVSSSLSKQYDEYTIKVDQATALQYGLSTMQIAMMLYPSTQDEVITKIDKGGKTLNVIVKRNKEIPKTFDELINQEVPTALGMPVKLSDIVSVEQGVTANKLDRSKGQFYASVSGKITTDDVSQATKELDDKINQLDLPDGVKLGTAGVMEDIRDAFTKLIFAMVAAVLIVYFILVVTFGEGLAPFAILFSLPFTVIGSFTALWITGETISVPVMMGILMLIGIVVTNAIVLVDRIIHKERDGLPTREAILEAGATRLRPILMTALATIGALLPLAVGAEGGGGFISKGLAVTVIGGLISSTLLTLIVVPIVYEILSKLFKKDRREALED